MHEIVKYVESLNGPDRRNLLALASFGEDKVRAVLDVAKKSDNPDRINFAQTALILALLLKVQEIPV